MADAALSLSAALLQIIDTDRWVALLELPRLLLSGTGEFMLAYAVVLATMVTGTRLWSAAVKLIVVGNLTWAGLSLALLFTGALAPSSLGTAFVVLQAGAVSLLAGLQWAGLRASVRGTGAWAATGTPQRAPR